MPFHGESNEFMQPVRGWKRSVQRVRETDPWVAWFGLGVRLTLVLDLMGGESVFAPGCSDLH